MVSQLYELRRQIRKTKFLVGTRQMREYHFGTKRKIWDGPHPQLIGASYNWYDHLHINLEAQL